jgi:hypothetical protein
MRAQDFIPSKRTQLRTYQVRIKLKQPGYVQQVDTTVQARNPEQARHILRAQYNNRNVLVGQPREIKTR